MTLTETTAVLNGVTYDAFDVAEVSCKACAAAKGDSLCVDLPPCASDQRDDGRNVIFLITKGAYVK